MSISSVSSVSDSGQTSTTNQITQYTDLGKNDFLKLICAQLKYQDPLSPVDNFDFLGQTAQFSMLEQVIDLNSRFDILAQLNDMAYVNSLLGKSVEWEDEEGNLCKNVIEKIEKVDGLMWLVSEDIYIAPSWVQSIEISQQGITQEQQSQD